MHCTQAKQAVAAAGAGQSAVALDNRPAMRPQPPAAVPAAAEAANISKAALPIDPAGEFLKAHPFLCLVFDS